MRAKLSIELEKEELEELDSIMRKCASDEDEVTVRLSSDKRKVSRYIMRVIEEQKIFWEDEGY